MNIFVLDTNPVKAAQAHCDKHVVKMILETAQIICTVAHTTYNNALADAIMHGAPATVIGYYQNLIDSIPYKATHQNHPCTLWAGMSAPNMVWLIGLFNALHAEWQYRYDHTKNHKSVDAIAKLDLERLLDLLPQLAMTPFAQAMPEYLRSADAVQSYRNYYLTEKKDLLHYTKREAPEWTYKEVA